MRKQKISLFGRICYTYKWVNPFFYLLIIMGYIIAFFIGGIKEGKEIFKELTSISI